MAFTKEQRLLVLMAIACMGLAVVSAGCMDNAKGNRDILNTKNKTSGLMKEWCECVKEDRDNSMADYETYCFNHNVRKRNFYNISLSFVNCSTEEEFKALIKPEYFCEGFKIETPTTEATTTTNAPVSDSSEVSTTSEVSVDPPASSEGSAASEVSAELPASSEGSAASEVSAEPPASSEDSDGKPADSKSSSPETDPGTTTSTPEDLTYLAWLIPLILLLVAAMLGLGCYLHRRTKGARGFHHSTKTNGSTKATNGEA